MKSHLFPHSLPKAKGFTLLELMVAMSVTVILLGMVTFMTGVSMDGYKGSRDKVLAGRQAKEALDAITKDFEAMVARAGGERHHWLYAQVDPDLVNDTPLAGPNGKEIVNACQLIFFTGAPDRYDGDIGGGGDNGGDVSAVSYRLVYRDQISDLDPNVNGAFPSFTLYRRLVNPDDTFTDLLGIIDEADDDDLGADDGVAGGLAGAYRVKGYQIGDTDTAGDLTAENVLAENIYVMTVTFLVQKVNGVQRFTIGSETGTVQYHALRLKGNTIQYVIDQPPTPLPLDGIVSGGGDWVSVDGQLVGVEIGMTVLSERGLVMTEKGGMTRQDIIKDYGIHYTHTVNVPRF